MTREKYLERRPTFPRRIRSPVSYGIPRLPPVARYLLCACYPSSVQRVDGTGRAPQQVKMMRTLRIVVLAVLALGVAAGEAMLRVRNTLAWEGGYLMLYGNALSRPLASLVDNSGYRLDWDIIGVLH
jgi:hypothetical protein